MVDTALLWLNKIDEQTQNHVEILCVIGKVECTAQTTESIVSWGNHLRKEKTPKDKIEVESTPAAEPKV